MCCEVLRGFGSNVAVSWGVVRPVVACSRVARRAFSVGGIPFPDRTLVRQFEGDRFNYDKFYTAARAEQYPKTLAKYWKVAQEMHSQGLIPFVHGQTAIWGVTQAVLEALDFRGCASLRLPSMLTLTNDQMRQKVDLIGEEARKHYLRAWVRSHFPYLSLKAGFDHDPVVRTHLLSVTIGAFHAEFEDSPFSLTFGGGACMPRTKAPISLDGNRSILPMEQCKEIARRMIVSALQERDMSPETIDVTTHRANLLFDRAAQLDVGNLLVIGVPMAQLSRMVYHSRSFGIPTGIPIGEVLEFLSEKKIRRLGYQARLMLCKDTVGQETGVRVVNIMNERAVEQFCLGKSIKPASEESILNSILAKKETFLEEKARKQIRELMREIDGLIASIFWCSASTQT